MTTFLVNPMDPETGCGLPSTGKIARLLIGKLARLIPSEGYMSSFFQGTVEFVKKVLCIILFI